MPLTRLDLRNAFERAGDEHWGALIRHHEDAYPNPKPTPGDIAKGEAERLNAAGYGDKARFELLASLVERRGGSVRIVHRLRNLADGTEFEPPPFDNYE